MVYTVHKKYGNIFLDFFHFFSPEPKFVKNWKLIYQHVESLRLKFHESGLCQTQDIKDLISVSCLSKVAVLALSGYLRPENFVSRPPMVPLQDPHPRPFTHLLNKKFTPNM